MLVSNSESSNGYFLAAPHAITLANADAWPCLSLIIGSCHHPTLISIPFLLFPDALDEIDGNPVAGEVYFDIRMGGEPGYIHYPKPGALAMRHGYLVNALRKKAMAQQS